MRTWKSENTEMELILQSRAKFMAVSTTKISALKGEETKVKIAACCDAETRSSMIQQKHAQPIEKFHTASVNTKRRPDWLGFGSVLIKGFKGEWL